jgi:hypothetical protein
MRTRVLFALGVFASVAVMAASCSRSGPSSSGANGAFGNPLAPVAETAAAPDSNPNHPPHPPHPSPKPRIEAVVFVSADSAAAGDSSVTTRWQLGNDSNKAFTMPWTLTSTRNWPGFPKSGSLALGARETLLLLVGVAVPDTATPGPNPLTMTVTQANGTTATASGAILVQGP